MPPAPGAGGGGNPLTQKYGPLPGWGWAAVAAGAVVVYRFWKARQSGSSSATGILGATQQAPVAEPSATLTTPGGLSYSGPLSGLQYAIPQGAMSATAAPSAPAAAASATSGYSYITDPAIGSALAASGVPIYTQLGPASAGGPIVPFQTGISYPTGSSELYKTGTTAG